MRRVTVFHRTGLRINIKDRVVRHGINKNVNRIKNIDVNCLRIRKEKKQTEAGENNSISFIVNL